MNRVLTGRSRRVLVVFALACATLLGGIAVRASRGNYTFHGITTESPPAADFALTAQDGSRVRLGEFRGKMVLLYFGYTNCPGICPTTLAEVNQALKSLAPEQAARVQVLMISVDPERDPPARLGAYLAHFNRTFIGLTGTPQEIAAVAAQYGIYYRKGEVGADGKYTVDHTSMVIVVDPAGRIRLLFPFGTSVKDMASDLGHLLAQTPLPPITVEHAWTRPLPEVATSAELYVLVRNAGNGPDRLLGASSPACGMVELYERSMTSQGAMRMAAAGPIDIPRRGQVEFKVDGFHLMCMERKQAFAADARFPLTLTFEKAGNVPVRVTVRDQ